MIIFLIFVSFIFSTSALSIAPSSDEAYLAARKRLLENDLSSMIGGSLTLSPEEEIINEELMCLKSAEFEDCFKNGNFLPSKNFMVAKDEINNSDVFKMIKKIPKGANLHLHDIAIASIEWVISELTYWPDLYMCYAPDNSISFRFFNKVDSTCDWKLVRDERKTRFATIKEFDDLIYSKLSLVTKTPKEDYKTIDIVWNAFEETLICLSGIIEYAPAWEAYLERAMQEMMNDNILYMEFRGVLPLLYDKDGVIFTADQTYDVYDKTIKRFTQNNQENFFGARFIYAPYRRVNVNVVWDYVELVLHLHSLYPDTLAGFDLVGQEDKGNPLVNFIEPLLYLSQLNTSLKLFFHAAETNWQGMSTDENLLDAFLLNTSRIGHGYGIVKHPDLVNLLYKYDVPLEICPISNQVLMLVDDLRNHPAIELISNGAPIVIAADDPAAWGADPLSHDFYEAVMALGGAKADLKLIKALALNSIRYSSLDEGQKGSLEDKWTIKWNSFINSTAETLTCCDIANDILPLKEGEYPVTTPTVLCST